MANGKYSRKVMGLPNSLAPDAEKQSKDYGLKVGRAI